MGLRSERKERGEKNIERGTGVGEGTAEPGDMPFMPPFHDTRSWYHALIGQSAQC